MVHRQPGVQEEEERARRLQQLTPKPVQPHLGQAIPIKVQQEVRKDYQERTAAAQQIFTAAYASMASPSVIRLITDAERTAGEPSLLRRFLG